MRERQPTRGRGASLPGQCAIFKANNGCLRAAKLKRSWWDAKKLRQGMTRRSWSRQSSHKMACLKRSEKGNGCRDRRVQDIGLEDGLWRDWKWQKKTVLGPDRSRTRHSHLKALQFMPEGLSSFANWAQMWTLELANKDEAQLWLGANIVPLIREVHSPNGSTKSKLRPIAHLETPLKLIVAVHQHADHHCTDAGTAVGISLSETEQRR